MSDIVLSVTQLNEYVRGVLSSDPLLGRMSVRGEVSGFKRHTSGHLYFILKDEGASIRCVMFRQYALSLGFALAEGMRVVLSGTASLYVRDGSFQFYAERMRADGEGALYQAFTALRDRLAGEGLFEASRKKGLPFLPRCVGVVTSQSGAALQDILRVSLRRHPGMRLLLSPTPVQGEEAPAAIAGALARLDAMGCCDVIIIGRGGGSMEDLWAFNTETVARAIASCATPVVSAVGHEIDVTIADFVADVRAATPSAAAEICVPELESLLARVEDLRARCASAISGALERWHWRCEKYAARLAVCHPGARLASIAERRAALAKQIDAAARTALETAAHRLALATARLEAMSPYSVLARGYAIVEAPGGLVTRASAIAPGEDLRLRMADGIVAARAVTVEMRAGEGKTT